MNKIIDKFLLTGNNIMPVLHLEQIVFTDSVCGLLTKSRGGIQKFRETENLKHNIKHYIKVN